MKHYYTIEIENIGFGDVRRVTIKANSKEQAIAQAIVDTDERIVAAWQL